MKKKEFQNLPSKETPINAENLNEMQSNIEESCVIVSPTEPTTNEKVWIQKGKNLFNKNTITSGKRLTNGNSGTYDSSGSATSEHIEILPNTDYCISNYTAYHIYDKSGIVIQQDFVDSATTKNVKTLENAYTMRISSLITDLDSVQLEQGSTATEYEPYIEKAIHTKNNNGVYEEITNLESKYKLLWKNNNPNSAFEGGDTTGAVANVTLLDSDYDLLLWLYKRDKDIGFVASNIIPKGYGGCMGYVNTYGTQNSAYREVVRIDDNNFIVSHGYKGDVYHNDDNIIPIFVYGIKF